MFGEVVDGTHIKEKKKLKANKMASPVERCVDSWEVRGQGGILRGELPSGGRRLVHTFAPATAVSLSVSIEGYRPSERVLVAAPHTALEGGTAREPPRAPESARA